MVRGRKTIPDELHVLHGNPSKKDLTVERPEYKTEVPPCPRWLLPEGRREWKRITPELEKHNLVSQVDLVALACYCQAYARLQEAEKIISEKGLITHTPNGCAIQNPAVGIASTCMKSIRAFCAEFGLTPSARSRMVLPKPETGDAVQDFLFGWERDVS